MKRLKIITLLILAPIWILLQIGCSKTTDTTNNLTDVTDVSDATPADTNQTPDLQSPPIDISLTEDTELIDHATPPKRDETPTGSRAKEFITSTPYTSLRIEIDYIAGAKPNPGSIQLFKNTLQSLAQQGLIKKSGGIEIVIDQELPSQGPDKAWTFGEIEALEAKHRQSHNSGTRSTAYFIYVDGHWHGDGPEGSVLGIAISGSTMVIFGRTISNNCQSAGPLLKDKLCRVAEANTVVHEMGHILGLVNNGLPMSSDHLDKDHGPHCNNKECLMYYTNNNTDMITGLQDLLGFSDDTIPFGQECMDDMAALHTQ